MAVKFGLWRVDGSSVEQVAPSGISSEERLEDILELRIEILGLGRLFQIGRQITTTFGKRIDLLAIDEQGDLYVIELKKDRTPRDVQKAPNMGWEADDPEQCEYLARVEWIQTRPREDAVWEKGMFANQNVVAKLRQPFTLQRLNEVFEPARGNEM